jgi:hypothetical protein
MKFDELKERILLEANQKTLSDFFYGIDQLKFWEQVELHLSKAPRFKKAYEKNSYGPSEKINFYLSSTRKKINSKKVEVELENIKEVSDLFFVKIKVFVSDFGTDPFYWDEDSYGNWNLDILMNSDDNLKDVLEKIRKSLDKIFRVIQEKWKLKLG